MWGNLEKSCNTRIKFTSHSTHQSPIPASVITGREEMDTSLRILMCPSPRHRPRHPDARLLWGMRGPLPLGPSLHPSVSAVCCPHPGTPLRSNNSYFAHFIHLSSLCSLLASFRPVLASSGSGGSCFPVMPLKLPSSRSPMTSGQVQWLILCPFLLNLCAAFDTLITSVS